MKEKFFLILVIIILIICLFYQKARLISEKREKIRWKRAAFALAALSLRNDQNEITISAISERCKQVYDLFCYDIMKPLESDDSLAKEISEIIYTGRFDELLEWNFDVTISK